METQLLQKGSLKQKLTLITSFILLAGFTQSEKLNGAIPRPDHVVICILENHGYPQVVGSANSPYISHLATIGANLQEYYALTHPSQPNYIMLFSGSNQGVTDNNLPPGTPWTTRNLGGSLIQAGYTFKGYSEDLPTTGSTVGTSGAYARKHSPWVHWQGTGTNQIPSSCNVAFSQFPSDFNQLPDVSFVIPNLNNDMHNGTDPSRIISGDEWVQQNLGPYINWAQNHNSLFVLLFDEDDANFFNRVPCIFVGPMVEPGNYATIGHHHYNFLRTLEEMYGLPYAGNGVTTEAINEIWRLNAGINDAKQTAWKVNIAPNPLTRDSKVIIENSESLSDVEFELFNILGSEIVHKNLEAVSGHSELPLDAENLTKGVYFYKIRSKSRFLAGGKLVVN